MSRRTIVVEGTTYKWQRTSNPGEIAVFPPKGGGGPRLLRDDEDHVPDPQDWREGRYCPTTPGLVAELIYRHILKRPRPERTVPPAQARPAMAEPAVPTWETSWEIPRVYAVTATLAAPGLPVRVITVEVHLDRETGESAVRALRDLAPHIHAHYARMVDWGRGLRLSARPVIGLPWGGEGRPMPGISDWLDAALEAGAREPGTVGFDLSAVPFRVPAGRRPAARGRDLAEREAERTLSVIATRAVA